MSPSGTITHVNETLCRWIGFTRDHLVGERFVDLLGPGSQLFYETRHESVLHLRGEVREVALSIARADGSALPILVNSTVALDDFGVATSVQMAIFDSTERQDYERDLLFARREAESSERRVRVLQDASSAFSQVHSEDEFAGVLAASVQSAFAATASSVWLVEDEDDDGHRLAGGRDPLANSSLARDARPERSASASGSALFVSNLGEAERLSPDLATALRAARLAAYSVVPLVEDGRTVGVVASYFGRDRTFDDHAEELYAALARQGAQVLGRIRLQAILERMALHDQLTGLANRSLLREQLERAIGVSVRSGEPLALIFLDLDGFKSVNDQLGHQVGDAVLRQVARRLAVAVRSGDVVGRFGGDEFLIIASAAGTDSALTIAERVRVAILEPFDEVPSVFSLSASVGVAVFDPEESASLRMEAMFALADAAMYESKNGGKDRVTLIRG